MEIIRWQFPITSSTNAPCLGGTPRERTVGTGRSEGQWEGPNWLVLFVLFRVYVGGYNFLLFNVILVGFFHKTMK